MSRAGNLGDGHIATDPELVLVHKDEWDRLRKGIADARAWLDSTFGEVNDFSSLCRILDRAEGRDVC